MPPPALQGATTRLAAKTAPAGGRLGALVLQFERHNRSPQPVSPDLASLRRAPGRDPLRGAERDRDCNNRRPGGLCFRFGAGLRIYRT